jgi:hypothetical protein
MEIGFKPKAGINYKNLDWETIDGAHPDAEPLGTAAFTEQGEHKVRGIEGFRQQIYNRPEEFEYQETLLGIGR